ncbi:MAG: transketolase C-terminal domain-containing protein, partial [bacterium]
PEVLGDEDADVGFVGFGSSYYSIVEAQDQLRDEGIKSSYFDNPAVIPLFKDRLKEFFEQHDQVYVVEQNYTEQFLGVIREEIGHQYDLTSIKQYDGDFMRPQFITKRVLGDLS